MTSKLGSLEMRRSYFISLIIIAIGFISSSFFLLISAFLPPKDLPPRNPTPMVINNNPKPIILLVPGFSAMNVLLGINNFGKGGFRCTIKPVKVALGDRTTYFQDFPVWLQKDGNYDVRIAYIENNRNLTLSIEKNAECLRKQILLAADESETRDVIIIAHSMGGLVARAYVQSNTFLEDSQKRGKSPVRSTFLIAVPNRGMPFHFWLNLILNCESKETRQRAACEFSSSKWLQTFNQLYDRVPDDVDFYATGGTLYNGWFGFMVGSYICLVSGPNDGTIPTLSAIGFENAVNTAYYPEAHLSIVGKPSYFLEFRGQKSLLYSNCIYPVILDGNRLGCLGTAPLNCDSSKNLWLFVIGQTISISLLVLVFKTPILDHSIRQGDYSGRRKNKWLSMKRFFRKIF